MQLEGWRSMPLQGAAVGTLLYFGGRCENVVWAPHMSSYLRGWSVVAFNYRGFGGSGGSATEAAVMGDAMAIHQRFVAPPPEEAGASIIAVAGRSLGTAVAVRVAAQVRPAALALVSPLCSVRALVGASLLLAPGRFLLRHPMDALSHAADVSCPALVLMAPGDRHVPNAHSLRLAARLAGPVTVRSIEGVVHRSLPRSVMAQQAIAEFLGSPGAGRA